MSETHRPTCLEREIATVRAERGDRDAHVWLAPGIRLLTSDETEAIRRLCLRAAQRLSRPPARPEPEHADD